MASFKELMLELSLRTLSQFNECTEKVNQNFLGWLDEFLPNALEQIKAIDNEAWRPKTPKRTMRKKRTSRKSHLQVESRISKKSEVLTEASSSSASHSTPIEPLNLVESDSASQSETEQNDDDKRMPPPPLEPIRSKRVAKLAQSSTRTSKRQAIRKSKVQSSNKKSKVSKHPSDSSLHLYLESVSTDEGTPIKSAKKTIPKKKAFVEEQTKVVHEYVEMTDAPLTRRTTVIRSSPKIDSTETEEKPSENKESDDKNVDIKYTQSSGKVLIKNGEKKHKKSPVLVSVEDILTKKSVVVIEKLTMPFVLKNRIVNNVKENAEREVENHRTPRLPALNDAKRSLHNNFVRSPQTPKQLFSAYTKGDIKEKALAFERAQLNSTVLIQSGNSPSVAKERRSSIRKKARLSNSLILAKAARMSTTTRRSSRVRHKLSAVYNNLCRTRLSDKENVSVALALCRETDEPDGVDDLLKNEALEKLPSVPQDEASTEELSTGGGASEKHENVKSSVSPNLSEDLYEPSPVTSSTSRSPENIKSNNNHGNLKKNASGQALKRTYPASETKLQTKVAVLISQYNTKCATSSKAQGFIRKKISSSAGLTNSCFKQIQKHSAISKPSRAALLEAQRVKEEEAYKKRLQILKEKMEESKRKNDEKQQKVKEMRLKEQQASEMLRRTVEIQNQNQMAAKKSILEKKKSLIEAKKNMRLKRELELERRRKEEEEQRLLRQKRADEQTQRELAKLKKHQEKREQEMKTAAAKAKLASNLNQTYVAEKSSPDSYDITPHRSELPKEELKDTNNYDIDDLKSGDETDDENDPRKCIPSWAQGVSLRVAVINQYRNPPNVELIFPPRDTCHLEELFKIQRKRFHARTSSAVWHVSPTTLE